MAYIKYKELTQSFNFFAEVKQDEVPSYVRDYINNDETVLRVYKTFRDKGVFTDKRVILFDQKGIFGKTKEISIIPYSSVCSSVIIFRESTAIIVLYLDSGYPLKLKFIRVSATDKTNLRLLYTKIAVAIDKQF